MFSCLGLARAVPLIIDDGFGDPDAVFEPGFGIDSLPHHLEQRSAEPNRQTQVVHCGGYGGHGKRSAEPNRQAQVVHCGGGYGKRSADPNRRETIVCCHHQNKGYGGYGHGRRRREAEAANHNAGGGFFGLGIFGGDRHRG